MHLFSPQPSFHCRIASRLSAAVVLAAASLMAACSSPGTAPRHEPPRTFELQRLVKTDLDRFAEAHQQRVFISLRRLAEKLYRRNPREWKKGGASSMEEAMARIFQANHGWRLEELDNRRDIDALRLAFEPEYQGDRVAAFVVGLAGMVQTAFGNKVEFYLLDELNAQHLYNAARNVEIAAWKLASARNADGGPLLLSNEMGEATNLSFEREFGRIIGQLEVLSDVVEMKTERTVIRVVQSMATAVFLPVR